MLELDAAVARREPHQIGEAQLRAGEVVPRHVGVLGRDLVGLDLDLADVVERDVLVVAQAEHRLDRRLDVAAAGVRLDVAVGDAVLGLGRQLDRPRLVDAAERERLHEAVARLDHLRRAFDALLGEQRRLHSFARSMAGVQPLDVAAAVDEGEQAGGAGGRDAERVGALRGVEPAQLAVAIAAPNGPTALVGWKPRWRRSGAQARASAMLVS